MYIHGMRRIYVQPWIWAAWIFVGRPIHTDDDENGFRIMSVRNSKHFSKDAFHNKSQLNRKCSRCFWSHLSGTTHTTLFSGRTIGRNFTITCCRWENVDHLMRRRKKNKKKTCMLYIQRGIWDALSMIMMCQTIENIHLWSGPNLYSVHRFDDFAV